MQLNVNSKGAIFKLVQNDLQSERLQKKLTILTIVILECFLLTFILSVSSLWQQEYDECKNAAQIIISDISDSDLEKLKQHAETSWIGEEAVVGATKQQGITLVVQYDNITQFCNQRKVEYSGKIPVLENEIMVSQNFLDWMKNTYQINNFPEIGDCITLDLTGDGNKNDYVISGIVEGFKEQSDYRYTVFVSKLGAVRLVGREALNIDAYVRLKLDTEIEEKARIAISSIVQKLSISEYDITLNPEYPFGGTWYNYRNTLTTVFPIMLLLLILAGLVIYSIFSVSITKKVRVYGQFRTIGMTRKQMRLLVRKEALYLAKRGIFIGLIIEMLIGYFFKPAGFNLLTGVIWGAFVSTFVLIMILIVSNMPAKIASGISPLEGTRYFPYDNKYKTRHKLQRKLNIFSLAVISLGRNRKKTITTMIMLGLCGTMLVIFASFGESYSADKVGRFYFYPHGDMQINISSLGNSSFDADDVWQEGMTQYQNNPLTHELMEKITKIDGVRKVSPATGIYVNVEREDGWADSAMQPSISKEQFENIKPSIVAGEVDYDSLVKKYGIMVAQSEQNPCQIGDICMVTMVGSDGTLMEYNMPIMAIYSQDTLLEISPVVPMPAYLFMRDSIKEMTHIENDYYCFEVDFEPEKEKEVETQLRIIVNENENLELNCLKDRTKTDQESTESLFRVIYLLIAILFLFSIINLVNIVVSNLYARRQEFGLLQAMGMTSIQINGMLQIESIFYTFGAGFLTLIVGSWCGYYLCKVVDIKLHCISYQYPTALVFVYLISLVVIQGLLSAYITYNLRKESIVERIVSD